MTRIATALALAAAGLAGAVAGCAATDGGTSKTTSPSPESRLPLAGTDDEPTTSPVPPPASSGGAPAATAERDGDDAPKIETFSAHVRAEVQPLGTIPYDNMTLPLVSPDGRHVATQTGVPPDWDTILAAPGATPPYATRIEIYTLPERAGDPAQMTATVPENVILGRGCDRTGFLVEAPRTDGSRWIGRAAWDTGVVTWLVRDPSAVSAFATAAADGSLAWSRVGIDDEHFELVVRRDGQEWRLPAGGSDWLLPTWSATTNEDGTHGLFSLMLRGDMMDAVHMDASSEERMYRTIQRLPLANRGASVRTAYQAMNGQVVLPGAPAAPHDTLVFLHPTRLRSAVWMPPGPAEVLDTGSFAAVIDGNDPSYVLMSTMKDLVRRKVEAGRNRSNLIAGPQVPRSTPDAGGYMLLNPLDGVIGLTRMRLLGP